MYIFYNLCIYFLNIYIYICINIYIYIVLFKTCHVGSKMGEKCSRLRYQISLCHVQPIEEKIDASGSSSRMSTKFHDWLFTLVHGTCITCCMKAISQAWQWND